MDTIFGQRLRQLRKEEGLTQQQLSSILGLDRTSVVKYETSSVGPSKEVMKKISDHFNVSIDYLLGNDTMAESRGIKILQRAVNENGLDDSEFKDILNYAKKKFPMRFEGIVK